MSVLLSPIRSPFEGCSGIRGSLPAFVQSALSQAIAVVSRLGGRMYAAPVGFDPYAFLNSDGSGGVSSTAGQLVGAALDLSQGIGTLPNVVVNGTPVAGSGVFAPWESFSTRVVMSEVAGWIRGTFNNTLVYFGQNGSFNYPSGTAVYVTFKVRANKSGTLTFQFSSGTFGLTDTGTTTGLAFSTTEQTHSFILVSTGVVNSYLFSSGNLTSSGDFLEVTDVRVSAMPAALTNAATQATTANKPIIAAGPTSLFNAFSFDGVNDTISTAAIAASSTETYVLSAMLPSVAAGNGLSCRRTTGLVGQTSFRVLAGGNLAMVSFVAGPTQATATGGTVSPNVAFTAAGCKAATRNYVRLNGVETGTVAATNQPTAAATVLAIGNDASFFTNASMYFYAWLPAEPTAAEFAILERAAGICSGQVTS